MLNANALRASMVENNCSVRELAEICGLKPKAFYQRLNGRVDFVLARSSSAPDACISPWKNAIRFFLRRKFPKGNKCPPRQL